MALNSRRPGGARKKAKKGRTKTFTAAITTTAKKPSACLCDIRHHPLGLQKRLPGQATLVNRNACVVVAVVVVRTWKLTHVSVDTR